MKIIVITQFPDMFESISHYGICRRALESGVVELECINPRDFSEDKHQRLDDRPYGGGPGMVMMAPPLKSAIDSVKAGLALYEHYALVSYLSPQFQVLKQEHIESLAKRSALILICGRYEGIDERLLDTDIDEEWSLGDYVISGGELGAMVLIDAVTRLQPGALGHPESANQDSFSQGLLDCPHYTRPEVLEGAPVPPVLLSGNHANIAQWRLKQALGRTWLKRPDLLEQRELSPTEALLLNDFIQEQQLGKSG